MKKYLLYISILAIVSLLIPLAISPSDEDLPEVEPKVIEALEENETVSVIVTIKDESAKVGLFKSAGAGSAEAREENQEEILEALEKDEFELERQYTIINSFAGELTEEGLEELASNPNVEKISYDYPIHLMLDASVPQINADDVWIKQLSADSNITGDGVTVCVIDTGIDTDHASLVNYLGGYDYVNGDSNPEDDHGHGTHVAGIISSSHATYKGVSYDANVVAVKVIDSSGSGSTSDVISAIQWCNTNRNTYNISVISMSIGCWGVIGFNSACDANGICSSNLVAAAVDIAVGNNISVFAASGNNEDGYAATGSRTHISSPACLANVTAVGSTNRQNDAIPDYVNRNSLVDLLAPGGSLPNQITSTTSDGSTGTMYGTSMATPHAAAAAALLIHARKLVGTTPTPTQVFDALNDTGVTVNDFVESGEYFQRIDVLEAYEGFMPPSIVFEFPANGSYYNYNVTYLNITTDRALSMANISVNGGANQTMNNDTALHYYLDITASQIGAEGWHNASYWVNCSDDDNEDNVHFNVDKTDPPAISGLSNQSAGVSWIYWNWTDPVDGGSGLNYVSAYRNGTNTENVTAGNHVYNMTCLNASTVYELATQTVDVAGNINVTYQNDTASTLNDSSGPTISVTTPNAGGTYSSSTLTYSITATDPSEISWCGVSTDGGSNQTLGFTGNTCDITTSLYTPTASGTSGTLADSPHTVVFSCNDSEGNVVTGSSISFSIDTSGGGGGGGGGTSSTQTMVLGGRASFSAGNKGTFSVSGATHTLTVTKITGTTAHIEIASTPIEFVLVVGESRDADIDGDYKNDITVKLNYILSSKAYITVTEIGDIGMAQDTTTNGTINDTDDGEESVERYSKAPIVIAIIALACLAIFVTITVILSVKHSK